LPGSISGSDGLADGLHRIRLLKNILACHPERSEGSQVVGKARFFALLRMTANESEEQFLRVMTFSTVS
jgi:hypothetical protein